MMNKLIKLTEKIEDKKLRDKVVKVIKDTELSSKDFKKYTREKLERSGSVFAVSGGAAGPVERDIINHTVQVTELVIEAAKVFEKNYELELDMDYLIAGSILHDIMKAYEFYRDEDDDLMPTGMPLDHTLLAVAELYHRDFPEEVIHIIASHPGEAGSVSPKSFEALIFHHVDSMCSVVEYYIESKKKMQQKLMALRRQELLKVDERPEVTTND
ncbi:MAG: HDIG domain-containing protein [Candidatus Aenigmarchaeota archaeon]|nr:HDIG domain-containing protein [Candidatus Aenigmarchaeota archaeon]